MAPTPGGCVRVALGSENPVKARGVREAYEYMGICAEVATYRVEGLPPQPVGLAETLRLAELRARRAAEALGLSEGVGVEAGFVEGGGRCFVVNAACVVRGGESSCGLGPSFEVPCSAVERSLEAGELDALVERLTGVRDVGSAQGLIGLATGNRVVRADLVRMAVIMALSGFGVRSLLGGGQGRLGEPVG